MLDISVFVYLPYPTNDSALPREVYLQGRDVCVLDGLMKGIGYGMR